MPARRHHFVPKWYLRQFGTASSIGVFDKWTGQFEVRHPKHTAVIEGLYDVAHNDLHREAIEELLADVESRAATIIRRVVRDGLDGLDDRDRMAIADYVAAQFLRVPAHRAGLMRAVTDRLAKERARLTDEEVIEANGAPLTREQIDLIRGAQISSNVVEGVVGGGVMMLLEQHSSDLRNGRWTWSLERVDAPTLITSDVPVATVSGGPASGDSGYADLPLDPSTVLVFRSGVTAASTAASRDFYLNGEGVPSARHFQRLMINRANRWLYGHPDNPLWATLS